MGGGVGGGGAPEAPGAAAAAPPEPRADGDSGSPGPGAASGPMRLWGETDPAVWRAWAARAPEAGHHLEAVGRAPGLPELDAWAVEVLPVLVRERWAVDGELGLTPGHFMRIMQWEALRAGRPPPAAEVRDVEKILRASTRRAFSALPLKGFSWAPVQFLQNIPGVDLRQASAVLSFMCPENYAYMSEAGLAATGEVEFTEASFGSYSRRMVLRADSLEMTPVELERALWASSVLPDG